MKRLAVIALSTILALNGCVTPDPARLDGYSSDAADVAPMVGDIVRGSDHWVIGRVERVVPRTDTTEAYLLVRRSGQVMDTILEQVQHGRITKTGFTRLIYVPTDVVVRRAGRNLFLNVPRIVVRKMPWREPPTLAHQQMKYGPPPERVANLYGTIAPSLHRGQAGGTTNSARPGMGTSSGNTDHREHEAQSDETFLPKAAPGLAYPAGKTALLIIDPVNDFLSPGGAAWEMTKFTVEKHNVVENLQRVIEGARARGIPVLFGPMAYTEADYKKHQLHRRSGINRVQFERKWFLAGSWGADFHPALRPRPGETVLLPHKGIDVMMTDLPQHLERLGITHLAIAGMTASLCVESTGRHAMENGYDVSFLYNAIGSDSHPTWHASVLLSYPMIGNSVITVDEFLAALPTRHN